MSDDQTTNAAQRGHHGPQRLDVLAIVAAFIVGAAIWLTAAVILTPALFIFFDH